MKKLILISAVFLCALQSQAQIAVINYMKVKPGGEDAFLASERTWKKLHQQRVNEGKLVAWEVYYIYGQGTVSQYNYATVDVYENMKAALQGITTDELKKAFGEKYAEVLNKTNSSRELVYSDMVSRQMSVDGKVPDKFLRVSFMSIKDNDKYYMMEEKAFKPMHQASADMGNMNSWSVWSRPFWNNMNYDAITVNGFTSVDQMTKMDYGDEVFKKATASMKPSEVMEISNLMSESGKIREMIRSQLWEVLEMTSPKK